MADTRPTPVGILRAVHLCLLLLFAPKKLIEAQEADAKTRNNHTDNTEREHSAYIVRRALGYSLLLVLSAGVIGYTAGLMLGATCGCGSTKLIAWLQVAGASLLLWGTLFVRGWEIETWSGVTFTERVNQWLYRSLYFIGTAVLVCSLAWPQCSG